MQDWMIVTSIAVTYLLIILIVGLSARRGQSSSLVGYAAGGRNLGLIVLFFILGAEIFSAFTFLGGPGAAYSSGAPALYILAYLSFALVLWWVLGPKIARLGRKRGYLTQADLISDRFSSKSISAIIAVVSVIAFVPYLTIQITGAGLLFNFATYGRVPFWLGALVAFGIVTAYVYTSGLKGIGWTNLIQGIMMLLVAWGLGLSLAERLYGGVGSMFREIQTQAPEFLTIPGAGGEWTWATFSSAILVSILGFIMWPHVFMRAYGADSDKTIRRTVVLYPLYALLVVPILFIGFAGVLQFRGAPLSDPDSVLLELAVNVANFSPWLVGLMLSGALAAAMSTGANLAHTASTVLVKDLFVTVFDQDMPEQRTVLLTRLFVVVISLLAYLLAVANSTTIVQLFLIAYGAVLQFLPLTIATFFWKRATTSGALTGLVVGLLVTAYFTFIGDSWFGIEAGFWGMIVNTILLVGVSLATRPMPRAHVEKFTEDSKAPLEQPTSSQSEVTA